MKKCGVYCIKNIITNKLYVGSSIDIENRIKQHKNMLKNNKHHSIKLQHSYAKHGENNFLFEIIEECDENLLLEKEQDYINKLNSFNNGYNCSKHTQNPMLGRKHSEETKLKISESQSGEKHHFYGQTLSVEHKEKLRIAGLGRIQTESTKQLISKNQKGKKLKPEHIQKIIDYHTGKQLSENHKNKISESMKGEKNHFYGQKHSEETLKLISDKKTGQKHTEETKIKMINSAKIKDKSFYKNENRNIKISNAMLGNSFNNKKIIQIDNDGNEIKIWDSLNECSKALNIHSSGISAVLSGKQKTTKGYRFKYITQ
jgi:group I intron endonuclease